jgi:RHS repeat-associated protein
VSSFAKRSRGATALWRQPFVSWSRRITVGLPLLVTVSLLGIPAHQAPAAERTAPAPVCPASRPDQAAALVTARLCKGRVQVADATTESSVTWANPEGTLSTQMDAGPSRFQRDGKWVDIDTDLQLGADGVVRAAAHPAGLELFGGDSAATRAKTGNRRLITAARSRGKAIALDWKGRLPAPVLNGDTATYRDVQPGMDVVVQLTATGFRQHTILKTRPSAPVSLSVPLKLDGLTARRGLGASVEFVDAAGAVVSVMAGPSMWGAQLDAVSRLPVKTAPVDYTLTDTSSGVDVTLTPDWAFLSDPATQYPVTIDPDVNFKGTFDTWVQQNKTTDGSADTTLSVGTGSGGDPARAFLNWNPASIRGKQVVEAHLGLWNTYSATCANRALDVYSTSPVTVATRWAYSGPGTHSQPPLAATKSGSTSGSKGQVACDPGYIYTTPHALDALVQGWADTTSGEVGMALKAPSETDVSYFKSVRSGENTSGKPFMYVTYNSYPTIGARQTSPSTTCATGTARPFVNTAQPTLKSVISDAEGATVTGNFEWWTTGGAKIGGATTGAAASGSILSTVVPSGALTDGGTYSWRVQGNDGTGIGPWSPWCEFTVDTTAPAAAPSVSSTTYPSGQSGGAAGTAGTFSFAANGVSDVSAFLYGLDVNPPVTTVNATILGGSSSASITPKTGGDHSLYVRSRDRAGNLSAITVYRFTVGAQIGAISTPQDGDLTAGKVVLTGNGAPSSTGVTYQWRRAEADPWTSIPVADVTTASGGAAVTWPVVTTGSGAFTALNWNVESTVNAAEPGPDALDGPLQVRATFSGATAGAAAPVHLSLDRDRAGAPTAQAGPGSVNLLTGNLTVTAADAVAAGGLGVSRSFNSRQPGGVDPLFGPGWLSTVDVSTAGTYRAVQVTGNLVQLQLPDGTTVGFTKLATTSTGATFEAQLDAQDLTIEYLTSGDTYQLTDSRGNTTTFTRRTGDPVGLYTPSSAVAVGTGDATGISWERTTVNGTDVVRPTTVTAPAPAGITCSPTSLVRGCKALIYTYSTTSSTGADGLSDIAGRIKQLSYTVYDPATTAMKTVVLARYGYDSGGRLRAAWDPRLDYTDSNGSQHQATLYGYDADGILTSVTPPAEQPWQFGYTTVPGDAGKGRLATVTRSALTAGTAVSTIVYRVPLSGTTAPADLSPTQTARWGQDTPPVDATAVFPPTQIPDGNQTTGTMPTSWRQASVTYLDGNARELNTREPGQHITATIYDSYGNAVRELTAGNRERALDASSSDSPASEATLAAALSSVSIFSADGQTLTEELGPEHDVVLANGNTVRGRSHTTYRYDEGAPVTDEPLRLLTSQTLTVQYWDNTGHAVDVDGATSATRYDWNLRQPIATIVDPGGLALTTTTKYDPATGQVVATTLPAGNDTSPSSRTTVYYKPGSGSGDTACDNHPEWANLPCRTAPAAQPASGPELTATYATYDMWGQPLTTTERNSGGVLRTTTNTYDDAGRPVTVMTAVGSSLGTAVGMRRTIYDAATGYSVRTEQLDQAGAVTAQVVRTFDTLGRITSYTDAGGTISTTSYDLASRPQGTSDGKATQTFSYDDSGEGRGLPNRLVDSQAGTFTATYDADEQLTLENRPDGLTVDHSYNEEGAATGLAYHTGSTTIYANYVSMQAQGERTSTWSTLTQSGYQYDNAGRLTSANQTTGTDGCTVRTYSFDANSNRKTQGTYAPVTDGTCQYDTRTTLRTWTYDSADRVNTTGYAYDQLGRTLTTPGADTSSGTGDATMTYYGNDMVRTISQAGAITTNTLDVMPDRYATYRTDNGLSTPESINHYSNDSDNPAWIGQGGTYTRIIGGLAGMAAIYDSTSGNLEWQIADLHGDIVGLAAGASLGLDATFTYDEYGNTDSVPRRYGYLGAAQRSADNAGRFIAMGVRAFNSTTGRFASPDPIYGGNDNAYTYPADPADHVDLDGRYKRVWHWWGYETRYNKRETSAIGFWLYEWPVGVSQVLGPPFIIWAIRVAKKKLIGLGLLNVFLGMAIAVVAVALAIGGTATRAERAGRCLRINRSWAAPPISWGSYTGRSRGCK